MEDIMIDSIVLIISILLTLIVSLILGGAFWFLIIKKAAVTNSIPNYADTVICIDKQNIRNMPTST